MASKHVHEITDSNFATEVLASHDTVLLDFTAAWCPPCKQFAPIIDSLADETVGTLKVGTVDIDSASEIAARFAVRAAPTVIVFRDGREIARHVGATSKTRLLALVR